MSEDTMTPNSIEAAMPTRIAAERFEPDDAVARRRFNL